MDPQTTADGTATIISLIVVATLAALWLVSWAERRVRAWLERRYCEEVRRFCEEIASSGPISDADADESPDDDDTDGIERVDI